MLYFIGTCMAVGWGWCGVDGPDPFGLRSAVQKHSFGDVFLSTNQLLNAVHLRLLSLNFSAFKCTSVQQCMHLTRQILSEAHSWGKEAPLSHAGLKRTHCLYCVKFWKTWSLILPPTWNIGTAQKHAWIRFIIAAHYFCWALHINCEWSDKITDDSKLNQPNCIWISVVPLNWVFYLIFASHCLPRALSLSLEHFLIYLNFLPYLSVCLSVHIFEANKAWCFRLEPNGWFCWVENDGLFPWSLSRQQIQQFLSEQGSVQQRGNSGGFVWSFRCHMRIDWRSFISAFLSLFPKLMSDSPPPNVSFCSLPPPYFCSSFLQIFDDRHFSICCTTNLFN